MPVMRTPCYTGVLTLCVSCPTNVSLTKSILRKNWQASFKYYWTPPYQHHGRLADGVAAHEGQTYHTEGELNPGRVNITTPALPTHHSVANKINSVEEIKLILVLSWWSSGINITPCFLGTCVLTMADLHQLLTNFQAYRYIHLWFGHGPPSFLGHSPNHLPFKRIQQSLFKFMCSKSRMTYELWLEIN